MKKLIYKIIFFAVNRLQIFIQACFGINQKKIVFISFGGKTYSDNPRAISEYLFKTDPHYKLIWLFNDPKSKLDIVPSYIKCVKKNSIKGLFELTTSRVWVDNFSKPLWMYKSKNQIYIQTWHGDRPFKKILYDAWEGRNRPEPLLEEKYCDYLLVGSVFGERTIPSAFNYANEVLKIGAPRNDLLFRVNKTKSSDIRTGLGINKSARILLFAPTFRKHNIEEGFQRVQGIDFKNIIISLQTATKQPWVCLVRAHSASAGLSQIEFGSQVRDVTKYEDMSELLYISDVLLTDYSSSAGDFAISGKPIILYMPDIEEYKSSERDLYFDIDISPFLVAKSSRELHVILNKISEIDWEKNSKEIIRFYGIYETGEASKKVVDLIVANGNNS